MFGRSNSNETVGIPQFKGSCFWNKLTSISAAIAVLFTANSCAVKSYRFGHMSDFVNEFAQENCDASYFCPKTGKFVCYGEKFDADVSILFEILHKVRDGEDMFEYAKKLISEGKSIIVVEYIDQFGLEGDDLCEILAMLSEDKNIHSDGKEILKGILQMYCKRSII